jgi:conjugal transfer pilus assembly protein TraK
MNKLKPLALLLAALCVTAHAQDDAVKANAGLAQVKSAISAELGKPLTQGLNKAVVDDAARVAATPAPSDAAKPAVQNRFIERANTGESKQVRTAPAVTVPQGPQGRAPIDLKGALAAAQREGGVALDQIQREINLPGLKKDDPSLKPFVIHTRNGVNEIVRMSGKLLNRIATPFAKPVVIDTSSSTAKVVGSDVYFMPSGEQPIGLFIVDSANTAQSISLTVIPAAGIPGQSFIIKLEDLRAVTNVTAGTEEEAEIATPRPSDYTGFIRSLMSQAVRGKVTGFNPVPLEGGVARLGPLQVTPEIAFTGASVDLYRYQVVNKSGELVDLTETAFYRKGVKAVSFFPSISLKPGQDTYVFLLADKPKSAAEMALEAQ